MKIEGLGHSCFLMTTHAGTTILTDPFDGSIGYDEPAVEADIVTMSHGHYDHHNDKAPKHVSRYIEKSGRTEEKDVVITGIDSFHDEKRGLLRGKNVIFVYETDGLRVAHLGDLGHILKDKQIDAIGKIDVLMIPVGGIFTLDAGMAKKVTEQIGPRIILPMHYQTKRLTLGKTIGSLDAFTCLFDKVAYAEDPELIVEKDDGQTGVIVMKLPE